LDIRIVILASNCVCLVPGFSQFVTGLLSQCELAIVVKA
jgi:hypothetical protein